MTAEDTTLWEAFIAGDKTSFETLYRRYFNTLYQYGYRKLENDQLLRDVIQELFVKLWTNRRNLRSTNNVRFYLLTALKNTLINVLVREGKKSTQPLQSGDDQFLMQFTEPAVIGKEEWAARSQQLTQALNQLSDRQKEIIYLRYFEEMDYDQIAVMMNISVGGVYKLHYRALDALKEILHISRNDLLLLLLFCKLPFPHG